MKNNCVFCAILAGEIPSKKFYEDELFAVVADIDPKAEKHYLALPKKHYAYLSDMTNEQSEELGKIFATIPKLAEKLGLSKGYRLIINQGEDAGQTVFHLHIHILGGQAMDFPHL